MEFARRLLPNLSSFIVVEPDQDSSQRAADQLPRRTASRQSYLSNLITRTRTRTKIIHITSYSSTFSVTCCISKSRISYEHDVCLSVCLSVTLVDCDRTVQQKMEIGSWQDRLVFCYPYAETQTHPDHTIPWSRILLTMTMCCIGKCGVLLPMARMSHYFSMCWASY